MTASTSQQQQHTSALSFPCEFTIKTMGKASTHFSDTVFTIIQQHVPLLQPSQLSSHTSRAGKYLAVRITIQAESQQQLDAIYQSLHDCDETIMSL